MQVKSTIAILLASGFILLVPLAAMQFTDEVVWDAADFAVAAALLIGTGLIYQLAARRTPKASHRVGIGIALAASLLLVWAHLAVGIL